MTLTLGSRPQHLEDADLVRYMDRQMDRAGNRRAELHLTTCAECAARLQGMRDRAHTLTSWLAELDVPPVTDERRALAMAAVQRARFRARPMAWASRPALAAAAMVALMLTAAFGTAPGRAWVIGAVERLGGAFPGDAPSEAPAAAPAPAPASAPVESVVPEEAAPGEPAATARPPARARRAVLPPGMSEPVPFNPTSNYVLLKFESRQRNGVATVWIRDIPRATAQVVAGRQAETLVPTGDGLQVHNTRGSRADYQVEIPTRYRFVRVQIGDEPEQVIPITRSRRDGLWSISLTDDGS